MDRNNVSERLCSAELRQCSAEISADCSVGRRGRHGARPKGIAGRAVGAAVRGLGGELGHSRLFIVMAEVT